MPTDILTSEQEAFYSDLGSKKSSDPDVEHLLSQIRKRQWQTHEDLKTMTPQKMAFGIMHEIPYKDWNTPLTKLGHWPRGSTIAEIKAKPRLMNYTPKQAIAQLFAMDEEMKRKKQAGEQTDAHQ